MIDRPTIELAALICALCLGLFTGNAHSQSHYNQMLDKGEETMTPEEENTLDKEKRRGGHRSAPILEVSVSPTTIEPGQFVTLKWESRFSKKGVLFLPDNQRYKKKGEVKLSPGETTDYKLIATNKYGSTVEAFTIEVLVHHDAEAPTQPRVNNIYALGRSIGIDWYPSSDDTTPQEEIIYHIHFAESTRYGGSDDLHFAGEVIGKTGFTIRNLPPNTEIDVFVSALDSAGNQSPTSAPYTVATGERDVALRDDLTIIQLSDLGIQFERRGHNLIIFPSRKDAPNLNLGDILIADNEVNSFTARVVELYRNIDKEVEVRIDEISSFELILKGDVNMNLKSDAVRGAL